MNSEPPAVITLPLSTLENMKMELAWRFEELGELINEIRTEFRPYLTETTKD
jgi:hypothetical protein